MNTREPSTPSRSGVWPAIGVAAVLVMAGVAAFWVPTTRSILQNWGLVQADPEDDNEAASAVAVSGSSIELSEQARNNISLKLIPVRVETFRRKITIPSIIVERPGHSQIDIAAPLTGIVQRVYTIQGAAVKPGEPLFDLRLTHEELVVAQSDFLQTVESLDVERDEIRRLESIRQVISGRTLLVHKYNEQKLMAVKKSQRQRLLLHGFNKRQVDEIESSRNLLKGLTVYAPPAENGSRAPYHLQKMNVSLGQTVQVGDSLCVLADHRLLWVEGMAFEEDAEDLNRVAAQQKSISATVTSGGQRISIDGLKILYLADHIDTDSRAFKFYLQLTNKRVASSSDRFVAWQYRPGQRLELHIPVEELPDHIVLPADAVVRDGAETYVYQQNGQHFDRAAVHVKYRDRDTVAIANDGSLFEGDIVVASGAYQIHLAIKNAAGVGVDPHAGHSH